MVWNIGDGKGGMAAFLCLINKSKVEGIVGLGYPLATCKKQIELKIKRLTTLLCTRRG